MRAVFRRLVAGAVLALAAGLAPGLAAPAAAASCSDGVTVVVDFGALGGGAKATCIKGGQGSAAATLFGKAGHSLTYVQRQPGFVCRISGKPTQEQDPCVNTPPASAYWGLFSSSGKTGTWAYATSGAGTLKVGKGGSVGFAWQSGSRVQPGIAPPKQEPKPEPSKATKAPASTPPSAAPTTPAPSASPTETATTPSPSASPSAEGATSASASPSASPRATSTAAYGAEPVDLPSASQTLTPPSESAIVAADEPVEDQVEAASSSTGDGGLPLWVPLSVIALGLAGAGAAYYRRRNG